MLLSRTQFDAQMPVGSKWNDKIGSSSKSKDVLPDVPGCSKKVPPTKNCENGKYQGTCFYK